jgi:hypothetical protein
MDTHILDESEKIVAGLKDIFSVQQAAQFMFERKTGIAVILEYIRARDWPWTGQKMAKDTPELIPLIWAVFHSGSQNAIRMVWDIHPTKCFPQLYNCYNPNCHRSHLHIVKEGGITLGGCARTFVTVSNRRYEVNEKTPEYCSIFGLPDDCFDPGFEKRMLDGLHGYDQTELWCFERTEYISQKVAPSVNLRFMKGEFLPSKYYIYVDTPEHFLKGIYTSNELKALSSELWYTSGRELIEEMDLDNDDFGFRFEEQAVYYLRKKLIYEFVRLFLLLSNRESFSRFEITGSPKLRLDTAKQVESSLQDILNRERKDKELYINGLTSALESHVGFQAFRSSRFMVLDVEYVHVPYPTDEARIFNFPCIFSSIIWRGVREGLAVDTNLLVLPCHFCTQPCSLLKRNMFSYKCLSHAFDFVEKQGTLVEGLLSTYDNFRIFTYGRSDMFQLEQGRTFFSDSFEILKYVRRNRKRAKRIVDISEDLSHPDKSLAEIEHDILERWLVGWTRSAPKVNVNSRIMTRYCDSEKWQKRYSEAINSCQQDTISAFLYLIYKRYRLSDAPIALYPANF